MLKIVLHLSVCSLIAVDGCTTCDLILGAETVQSEHRTYCRCTDVRNMIQIFNGDLACKEVPAGKYADNVTFELKDTNCGGKFYNYETGQCTECNNEYERSTANGLCVLNKGIMLVNGQPQCMLGFGQFNDPDLRCAACDESYSVDIEGVRSCGKCQLNQFRYLDQCMDYTDENCAKLNPELSSKPLRCVCPNGELPVLELLTGKFLCGQACIESVHYMGHGIPSRICRESDKTVLNTTCRDKNVDEKTGLCACGKSATMTDLDADGKLAGESYCVGTVSKAHHIKHCNENGVFYHQYKDKQGKIQGGLYCTQSKIPWRICTVYQSTNCTPCSDIEGATSYQSEMKMFCYCREKTHLIYEQDFQLKCAAVPQGKYVRSDSYQLVDIANRDCNLYMDYKNNQCTSCEKPARMVEKIEESHACNVKNGYLPLESGTCALGFLPVKDENNSIIDCQQCEPGTSTIITGQKTASCGVCNEHQFRYTGWCLDFKRQCSLMGTEFRGNRANTQCICGRGKIPQYSLKTKLYICGDCENGVYSYYDGEGLPSKICRQPGKTVYNTTCPQEYPLDESTGLCKCPEGLATVVYEYSTGKFASFSVCRRIYLASSHLVNCGAGLQFVFQHLGQAEALCLRRSSEDVFKEKYFISNGEIAGITVGIVAIIAIAVGIALWIYCLRRKESGVKKDKEGGANGTQVQAHL